MGIVNTKGNESVLPWYKGEGREKEKVSVHRVISFDILSRNGYNYKKKKKKKINFYSPLIRS